METSATPFVSVPCASRPRWPRSRGIMKRRVFSRSRVWQLARSSWAIRARLPLRLLALGVAEGRRRTSTRAEVARARSARDVRSQAARSRRGCGRRLRLLAWSRDRSRRLRASTGSLRTGVANVPHGRDDRGVVIGSRQSRDMPLHGRVASTRPSRSSSRQAPSSIADNLDIGGVAARWSSSRRSRSRAVDTRRVRSCSAHRAGFGRRDAIGCSTSWLNACTKEARATLERAADR